MLMATVYADGAGGCLNVCTDTFLGSKASIHAVENYRIHK